MPEFNDIIKNFRVEGEFVAAYPFGFGHINDTYVIYFRKHNGEKKRYILQRINKNIFKSPQKLMENIEAVTSHIRKKIISRGGDAERETLNIIYTKNNTSFYNSTTGEFWRMYVFIENARTYQIVESEFHFYNAGKAFGKFQEYLSDFPAHTLYETIPDFHNTPKRYKDFLDAVTNDTYSRVKYVQKEIEFVFNRQEQVNKLTDLISSGTVPIRVTHNDTKFNNVMIDDRTGDGVCVIDLDTVMPGLSLYDFGDSIRSGTNIEAEDEKDIQKVSMDIRLFECFTRGYLESTYSFLTEKEISYLPFSAKLMTFECGMRFLTDYLCSDKYFKTEYTDHNLVRARTQFKMVEDIEKKMDKMEQIVFKNIQELTKVYS